MSECIKKIVLKWVIHKNQVEPLFLQLLNRNNQPRFHQKTALATFQTLGFLVEHKRYDLYLEQQPLETSASLFWRTWINHSFCSTHGSTPWCHPSVDHNLTLKLQTKGGGTKGQYANIITCLTNNNTSLTGVSVIRMSNCEWKFLIWIFHTNILKNEPYTWQIRNRQM